MTGLDKIYDRFLGKITDDMYMEDDPAGWTYEDTIKDLYNILCDAVPMFEFPRKKLTFSECGFEEDLTDEEINIIAVLMMNTWLQRQITSIENTRMKYSGTDFKMTSQANHLQKLIALKTESERQDRHIQRLYKRRKTNGDGYIESNWSILIKNSALDGR